jgi:5-methyltetrahydrofolate--homocysteine methyltransferase
MLDTIYLSVIKGDAAGTVDGVRQALEAGDDPAEILNHGMIAAMTEIGRLFECGDVFIPEMLIAARAMKAGLAALRPRLVEAAVETPGTVVLGTVRGDLHDMGKNLVGIMFEGAGFKVIDLGVSVAPEQFVEAVREHHPDFLGLSALLTTTMPAMGEVVEALKQSGLRDDVKVMVGGAPINQAVADEVGADLYARDAAAAVSQAKALLAAA